MIEARDVSVWFRRGRFNRQRLRALDGFSLQVGEGEVMAILGPNGCGKSTAMHTMLGLIQPDAGSVRVAGMRPEPGSPLYDRIAYLPEEPHYHLYLTVEEAVRYYASLHRKRIPESRLCQALELVGLADKKDLLLRKCSKGMKQKAGIAVCLATEPELIFLDEPMRGLDPQSVKIFRDALQDLNTRGSTIVLNSHILAEVEMICTHVAIVRDGKVLDHGPIGEFRSLDLERYVVEIEPLETLPECFQAIEARDGILVGSVPAPEIQQFMSSIEQAGSRVLSAQLSKFTLEQAFLAAFDSEERDD